jgi:hypothetical protein
MSAEIFPTGSSLIYMLHQQSYPTTHEDTSSHNKHSKLSTLFNTTGRERNSTGPLKQWLYEHRDHPCK